MYKLAENVTEEMLVKEGFKPHKNYVMELRRETKRGYIAFDKSSKTFSESVRDSSTYSGYKYQGEYKQQIKRNILDLISKGMVVEC